MSIVKAIQENGFVGLDYITDVRRLVESAIASWMQFCSLSRDQKLRFGYADEGNLDGAGYELKEATGDTLDLKESFHVTLKASPRLMQTAADLSGQESGGFIRTAVDVFDAITPLVLEFAEAVRDECGIEGFDDEVMASRQNWFLRYLHYFGDRKLGDEIATPHADKSGFTLHLYESTPGLQYLELSQADPTRSRMWRDMPVSDGKTVVISGMQLQFKSNGQLKALSHRVVATPESALGGRYSMVCFIPLLKTPMFNKLKLGRLQDQKPGFNYDMPPDEFAKLFAK